MPNFEPLVLSILSQLPSLDTDGLKNLQREFSKTNTMNTLPSKSQILQAYFSLLSKDQITKNPDFESLLKKRAIRSQSGIVSVQVLTKPRPCPGTCIFCPNDPELPKSYLKSEPGAMRAWLNHFDPIKQVYNRLQSLTLTGHTTEKIEMIVLGGTRDYYPPDYKKEFIKQLYDACNTFDKLDIQMNADMQKSEQKQEKPEPERKYGFTILNQDQLSYASSLEEALHLNETASHRIIGLTIETRPDFVTDENCLSWRELGVTRIEMGVQSTDDEILSLNQRDSTLQEVQQAMHKLRQYGFKISIHLMPGLYGSSFQKDLQTFIDTFSDPYLKPDEIKFYPTSVLPHTKLYELYQEGKYQPLTTEDIASLIKETFQTIIPPYTRIKRLIRDIPATEIAAGSNVTNLSQLVHDQLLSEYKEKLKTDQKEQVYSFYQRLYGKYQLSDTFSLEVLESFLSVPLLPSEMQTLIVGSIPDLTSYRHFVSLDTRSREVRHKTEHTSLSNLILRRYQSSNGQELFLSYEDELGYLYGFTRLLLPSEENALDIPGLGKNTAIIRELHVYGDLQKIGEKNADANQHSGFGKKLLSLAEQISSHAQYKRLSVISGVGVREYYQKQGFSLEGTYMIKYLGKK